MPILRELAIAVKERRGDLGLSQQRLAGLSGLSRATISDLESGKLQSLSLDRAERLANELGFAIVLAGARSAKAPHGIELAAQTASVSFSRQLPPAELEHAFLRGTVPPAFIPHLKALLDEAPLSVLADAVSEIEKKHRVRRISTWERMRQLARAVGCRREIWLAND